MSEDSWFPWGQHKAEDSDYQFPYGPETQRYYRLSPRVQEILAQELSELHLRFWYREDDDHSIGEPDPSCHIEMCAFGPDGYSAHARVSDLIDAHFHAHKRARPGVDAKLELNALRAMREAIEAMIAERESAGRAAISPSTFPSSVKSCPDETP